MQLRESQGDRARGMSAERIEMTLAGGGAQFAPGGDPSRPGFHCGEKGIGDKIPCRHYGPMAHEF